MKVDVSGLTVAYGAATRLHDVTCGIAAARITAILGPSGCGKSTLLRVLNRTLELIPGARVVRGAVRCGGLDLYGAQVEPMQVRTQIGLLQQRPTAFPMSILDNVLFGARFHGLLHGEPVDHARPLLERVGLWHEVKDRLHASALALSGGQQQRLCLARTLATQPRVLLMDEPCSALDPRASAAIEALLRELAGQYTVAIVTHNVAQARRLADRCIFIEAGRVVAEGPRDEILLEPRAPALRDYLAYA